MEVVLIGKDPLPSRMSLPLSLVRFGMTLIADHWASILYRDQDIRYIQ